MVCDECYDVDDEDRVTHVQYIIPFALKVLGSLDNNGLFEVLYLYEHYDFGNVVRSACKYINMMNDQNTLKTNVQRLNHYLDDPNSIYYDPNVQTDPEFQYYKPTMFAFQYKSVEFDKYTRDDLKEFLEQTSKEDLSSSSEEVKTSLIKKLGPELLDDLIGFLDEYNKSINKFRYRNEYESKSFIDGLHSYGHRSVSTWKPQNKFHTTALQFLMKKISECEESVFKHDDNTVFDFLITQRRLEVDGVKRDEMLEKFGLL